MNRRRIYFIIYYLVSAAAVAILYGRYDWLAYYRLANQGTVVAATVTATDCQQSKTISYRFALNGREYRGSGGDGYGTPPCASLKPGDTLQAAYLAAAPETNLPGSPRERLVNETIGVVTGALIVPLVILFLFFVLMRRFRGEKR
jgi:hypothetical protein